MYKSPMNYLGNKYKLLEQILPLFPKNIDTFVDLFAGGLDVSLNTIAKNYIINDSCMPMKLDTKHYERFIIKLKNHYYYMY